MYLAEFSLRPDLYKLLYFFLNARIIINTVHFEELLTTGRTFQNSQLELELLYFQNAQLPLELFTIQNSQLEPEFEIFTFLYSQLEVKLRYFQNALPFQNLQLKIQQCTRLSKLELVDDLSKSATS